MLTAQLTEVGLATVSRPIPTAAAGTLASTLSRLPSLPMITITLESSTDPYLYLRGGAGRDGTVLCENDDYASEITSTLCGIIGSSLDANTDSGIVASLVEGAYTIEATTYEAGATGAFVLTVSGLAATTGPQPHPRPSRHLRQHRRQHQLRRRRHRKTTRCCGIGRS